MYFESLSNYVYFKPKQEIKSDRWLPCKGLCTSSWNRKDGFICQCQIHDSKLFILPLAKSRRDIHYMLNWHTNLPHILVRVFLTYGAESCKIVCELGGFGLFLQKMVFSRVVSILQKSSYLKCQVMGSNTLLTGMFMQIFEPLALKLRLRWIAQFY